MSDDLMTMQRQAARRVQQMQEHSRRVFEAHQSVATPAPIPCDPSPPLPRLETEQWLLLGLALLMMRCGKTELTLALLYLAL